MNIKPSSACPCCSGKTYGACCRPYHAGAEPPDAESLMRSRYSAFAASEIEYLIRTLHPEHPDAVVPRDALGATLREACRTYKYTGLTILESRSEGEVATVVFRAKVFDKGRDLSFTEASQFERVGGAWRYRSGETLERQGNSS